VNDIGTMGGLVTEGITCSKKQVVAEVSSRGNVDRGEGGIFQCPRGKNHYTRRGTFFNGGRRPLFWGGLETR